LTRVYNGRSTTIFCVTSVTRRLLDTTTSAERCVMQTESRMTAEVRVNPAFHRFLIGRNGMNLKELSERTGARLVFSFTVGPWQWLHLHHWSAGRHRQRQGRARGSHQGSGEATL